MIEKKHHEIHRKYPKHYFSDFLDDPLVAASFVAIALIALMFTILEFTSVVGY